MRKIGVWMSNLFDDDDLVLPHEVVGSLPQASRDAVAAYLDRGEVFETFRGNSSCLFGCDTDEATCWHHDLTDGHWVWPEGLAHYVRAHNVMLPDEFWQHVESGTSPSEVWMKPPADLSFWKTWCRAHTSEDYRHRLQRARLAAENAIEQALRQEAAKQEADQGLSDQRCQWVGCTRRALKDRALCARCNLKGTGRERWVSAYYALNWVIHEPPLELLNVELRTT